MAPTRWSTLVVIALSIGSLTWVGDRWMFHRGGYTPEVGWLVLPVELLIAGVVLFLGLRVRQYLRGERPGLDGLRAARTATLAKAAAYTGSLLLGWYGGQTFFWLSEVAVPAAGGFAIRAGLAFAGALVLAIVGMLTERMCQIPPADKEPEPA